MKCQNKRLSGFTIVELMVVVFIIGILAVITVSAFNAVQRRANESASATAVESANKKLEVYKIANSLYPQFLSEADVENYANTTYQYSPLASYKDYCLTATTNNASMFGSKDNPTPAKGGCAGHAVDGIQPITNFVLNPSVENTLLNYGWSAGSSGATASTDFAYSGTRSAKVVGPATAIDSFLINTVTVPSAGTYTISAYVRIASTNASFGTACSGKGNDAMWYNGLVTVNVCYNRSTLNTWQRLTNTVTLAAGATMQLRFYPPAGSTMYVDGLMVSNGSSAYADGTSTGWVWGGTGAAHQNVSYGLAK